MGITGDRYEGDFIGGERTGQGTYTWHNGERYEGTFEGDQLQGTGKFFWPDGRHYEGTFVAGKKSGTGTFEWPNGNRYVGPFANDAREGLGVFYWRDGTVYEGTFARNKMDGFGVKRTPDGQAEFQQWREGSLVLTQPLVAVKNCRITIDGREWMFQATTCKPGQVGYVVTSIPPYLDKEGKPSGYNRQAGRVLLGSCLVNDLGCEVYYLNLPEAKDILRGLGFPSPLPIPHVQVEDVRLVYSGRTIHVRGRPMFTMSPVISTWSGCCAPSSGTAWSCSGGCGWPSSRGPWCGWSAGTWSGSWRRTSGCCCSRGW